jgi:hypothetical protein
MDGDLQHPPEALFALISSILDADADMAGIGISTIWNYGLNSNITWEPKVTHRLGKISYQDGVELKKHVYKPGIGKTEKQ